ncbi:pilus assembly protein PilP [Vulgatibacter sp.]|uniref:pilus assembly protein PilP n=1 Tax=Vulgatibacter sp. TaxID=1971226 RepID=UPI003568C718
MRRLDFLAVTLGAIALAGCEDAPKAPPKPAAPAAKAKAAEPAVAAEAAAAGEQAPIVAEYVYTPIGKRDPFRSFFDSFEPVEPQQNVDAKCGLLCQFELDQLRLVAVVSGVASPLAMVEDPDGRGHMVRRGSHVGKRSGRISDIRRDRVVVTELLRNKQGQILPVQTEMPLRSQDGTRDKPSNELIDLSMADGR